MELAHSLYFNENAHKSLPSASSDLFLYEWLKYLSKVLPGLDKKEIKQCQESLEKQILALVSVPQSSAIQKCLGEAIALLFNVGETFGLYAFIESCNEKLRVKDDTSNNVKIKICVLNVFFAMYSTLGRMMGNTFADTIQILLRNAKSNDAELRSHSLLCLGIIQINLGAMCTSYHRDVYKVAKSFYNDKSMQVRASALKLLESLIPTASFIVSSPDIESVAAVCFKSLENCNYDVRLAVSSVISKLLTNALPASKFVSLSTLSNASAPRQMTANQANKKISLEECVGILASGFIKSSNSPSIRVGLVEAYIAFFDTLGKHWTEKHIRFVINHALSLLDNPKMTASHIEAVHCRRSVNFILNHVINQMIGEKTQNEAAKVLIKLLSSRLQQVSVDGIDPNSSINQHFLICILNQISSLISLLGSSISVFFTEHATGAVNTVISTLLYPVNSVSLAAAWCLRCIVIAVPGQLSVLMDSTQAKIEASKNSPESLIGYSNAMSAILGAVPFATLGVPSIKAKNALSIAEDLLRTASQNSRMSSARTQCGWMIIGALMTLGSVTVRHFLSKLLLLWRNAFPRSAKEIETEKSKFDQFNWQVALEGRAGALSAMESFLQNCPELISDDVTRRLLTPLECALTMLANLPTNVKSAAGQSLKVSAAFLRLRLFSVLGQLSPECYESSITQLIRVLVNEFALTDKQSSITTSYMEQVSHKYNCILLGAHGTDSDHQEIEEQLMPYNNAVSCGTLEHDPVSIYSNMEKFRKYRFSPPGPLPLGVAVVDASVILFSKIFCATAVKHRIRIIQHFTECLKQTKSVKHQSIQLNILTVLLSCLKTMAETKAAMGSGDLQELIWTLLHALLGDSSEVIRCAAAECVGRLAQVVADNNFTAKISQSCFDKIQLSRDPTIRMGNALTLGFVHRYVGGIGAGQHLSTSISICLALAQDMNSSSVQVWALHSLVLITDSGGAMIRSYVDHILALMINLLMNVPSSTKDVHRYIGKCIASLITILGPELQGSAPQIANIRSSCQLASDFLLGNSNLLVIAEGVSCYQQLHLFSPKHAALSSLINILCKNLSSSCLVLRQVSCSCLKQLSQRQADLVSQMSTVYFAETREHQMTPVDTYSNELELEATLFTLLDKETDLSMQTNVKDTILMILNSQAIYKLSAWLTLLRNVLFIATGEEATEDDNKGANDDGTGGDEDDDTSFQPVNKETCTTLHQRCNTRVFAVQCVQKIFSLSSNMHLTYNYCLQGQGGDGEESSITSSDVLSYDINNFGISDPLITHIQELVRIGFMAATASYDQLQIEGLKVLEQLIERFCQAKDPDFNDQPLLEQYQAQFGAALRPAFLHESFPHVLSKACNLCSIWITSGIATDIVDLRRIHQLLLTSLSKVQSGSTSRGTPNTLENNTKANCVFSECSATSERLAVLKAWADMYFVALGMEQSKKSEAASSGSTLLDLVIPELEGLYSMWIEALKEYGLSFSNANGPLNDEVPISVRESSWGNLLCSATLYFTTQVLPKAEQDGKIMKRDCDNLTYILDNEILSDIHLIFGLSTIPLTQSAVLQNPQKMTYCLQSLVRLLEQSHVASYVSGRDCEIKIVELAQILFKIALTSSDLKVLELLIQALTALTNCAISSTCFVGNCDLSEKSLLKVLLETVGCLFSRHVPCLRDTLTVSNIRPVKKFREDSARVVAASTKHMLLVIQLTHVKHKLAVMTTIMHMLICALKDSCMQSNSVIALKSLLHCIKSVASMEHFETASPATQNDTLTEDEKQVDSVSNCEEEPTPNKYSDSELWCKVLTSVYMSVLDFVETSDEMQDVSRCLLSFITITLAFPHTVTLNQVILDRSVAYLTPLLTATPRTNNKIQYLKVISSLLRSNKKVLSYKFFKPVIRAISADLDSIKDENPDEWQCVKDEIDILLVGVPIVNELCCNDTSACETMLYHVITVLCKLMRIYSNQSPVYQHCINSLKSLSVSYGEIIRQIFAKDASLKCSVGNAVKRTVASSNDGSVDGAKGGASNDDASHTKVKQPSIQLKIDFSSFANTCSSTSSLDQGGGGGGQSS